MRYEQPPTADFPKAPKGMRWGVRGYSPGVFVTLRQAWLPEWFSNAFFLEHDREYVINPSPMNVRNAMQKLANTYSRVDEYKHLLSDQGGDLR